MMNEIFNRVVVIYLWFGVKSEIIELNLMRIICKLIWMILVLRVGGFIDKGFGRY